MKSLAIKDMLKNYYHEDPTSVVYIISVANITEIIRPFIGILVDAKVIPTRKIYMIVFALLVALSEGVIAMHWIEGKENIDLLTGVLFIDALAQWFLDATITSYMVQQGRKDPV